MKIFKKEQLSTVKESAARAILTILKKYQLESINENFDAGYFFSACEMELDYLNPRQNVKLYLWQILAYLVRNFPQKFET